MSFKLVNVTHHHCVFTIDQNLRHFFLEDRSLLDMDYFLNDDELDDDFGEEGFYLF